jgi:hypothetical protein
MPKSPPTALRQCWISTLREEAEQILALSETPIAAIHQKNIPKIGVPLKGTFAPKLFDN